ncbi:hypothetical protein HID58_057428 [Brassica napus]|uniref:thioglucosidase n=1 Tax=Brassica napus TaxID=3708 RepID=A0ABQ8AR27_BRANA|nr:hypothetical protein HID58_057428 [Brassica napus]
MYRKQDSVRWRTCLQDQIEPLHKLQSLSTMAIPKAHYSLAILVILFVVSNSQNACNPECKAKEPFNCDNSLTFNRTGFPKNFTFGAATSALRVLHIEPLMDGTTKLMDIQKGFQIAAPETLLEDVKLLKRLKVQAYRLSIAWSRVLPKGRLTGGVDENGITYYNNLINELKTNGIEPFVTIFHWDVPQTLEDEYGGFLSPRIVEDFKNYAELLFQRFGDRVKFWITLNQPYSLSSKGYGDGSYPPGRCTGCEFGGDSGTEPYIVTHHQLLAHAEAVSLYRKRYQKFQGGKIGTTLIGRWFAPLNETSDLDQAAAKRAFQFFVGWFLDPLVYGEYPRIMRELVGDRLPKFTPQESDLVKGSLDFLGLNYYVTQYASDAPPPPQTQPSVLTDPRVTLGYYRNGVPIGVEASISPSFVYYPPGFRQILNHIKDNYQNPLTYITENGVADYGNLTVANALADNGRIQNHCSHLSCLKCSIEDGCNVAGYFAWSLMDNYEFGNGYTLRFGMNWVNFTNPADRRQKDSGKWYSRRQVHLVHKFWGSAVMPQLWRQHRLEASGVKGTHRSTKNEYRSVSQLVGYIEKQYETVSHHFVIRTQFFTVCCCNDGLRSQIFTRLLCLLRLGRGLKNVLELAGNAARDNKKTRIVPRHIQLAVRNDEELSKLLGDVTIAYGGVMPNIHNLLLP